MSVANINLRKPLIKAHWEAWSRCNLRCGFCYRMRAKPLDTDSAKTLLSNLVAANFRDICFAGGDPLLRKDIGVLVLFAKSIGLNVEVQTNSEIALDVGTEFLRNIDLFGFSIDGANAATHDAMRGKSGNFDRVFAFMDIAERLGIRFIVRTVVTRQNTENIIGIGEKIRYYRSLVKWCLVEFSEVGDGYKNSAKYQLREGEFLELANKIKSIYINCIAIDVYQNAEKKNVYFLVKPNGDVYTTGVVDKRGSYSVVGNAVHDPIDIIIDNIHINGASHEDRYAKLFP